MYEDWQAVLDEQVRIMRYRVPTWIEIDDIRQAAAEGLLRALRADPDPERIYVVMRIRGAVLDELRRRLWWGRAGPRGSPRELTVALEPQAPAMDTELADAVRVCLPRVPARERLVLERYFFEETPMRDIARELGVSEPRASQLKSKGLELLRQELVKTGYCPPRHPSGAPAPPPARYRNPLKRGSVPAPPRRKP